MSFIKIGEREFPTDMVESVRDSVKLLLSIANGFEELNSGDGICVIISEGLADDYDQGQVLDLFSESFKELGYDPYYPLGEDEYMENLNLWRGLHLINRIKLMEELIKFHEKALSVIGD